MNILQKRQQLFRQYAATQKKETLVLSNNKSEKIDADLLHIVSHNDSACEPWVKELNLFQKDMNILRSKKEWINDDIINAAQHLLKDINPALSGFQSTACGLVLNFNSETREFVQILYGENHWNVISSIGVPHGTVEIFDSMYTKLSDAIKMQIANIVYTSNPHITILFQNVQKQSGSSDCGLFSIAFATALVYGISGQKTTTSINAK